MKFKEIEPGMVIHCPSDKDALELMKHLETLGYYWFCGGDLVKGIVYANSDYGGTVYFLNQDKSVQYSSLEYAESNGKIIIDFHDLIEPEGGEL